MSGERWTGWAGAVGGKGPVIVLYSSSPDGQVMACTGIRSTVQPLACTPARGFVTPLARRDLTWEAQRLPPASWSEHTGPAASPA
jgi:hypothetical protein